MSTLNPTSKFVLEGIAFFGRTLNEYLGMFAISLDELKGQKILDCPSGPASFVAEATKLGIEAIGCDPLYLEDYQQLADKARKDIIQSLDRTAKTPELFYRQTPEEITAFRDEKLKAAEIFAADYTEGLKSGRYINAALPELPFADKSFDIALSGNLLFLYTDHKFGGIIDNSKFDYDFHLKAIQELVHVTRNEIRLYPIEMPKVGMHQFMEKLIPDLKDIGIESRIMRGTYRDIRGADHTLVLNIQ